MTEHTCTAHWRSLPDPGAQQRADVTSAAGASIPRIGPRARTSIASSSTVSVGISYSDTLVVGSLPTRWGRCYEYTTGELESDRFAHTRLLLLRYILYGAR